MTGAAFEWGQCYAQDLDEGVEVGVCVQSPRVFSGCISYLGWP